MPRAMVPVPTIETRIACSIGRRRLVTSPRVFSRPRPTGGRHGRQAEPDRIHMTSEYDQFITTIQHHAGVSWEGAERAARATLQTLGERIAAGEARDLAERLPPEAAPWIFSEGDAQAMS